MIVGERDAGMEHLFDQRPCLGLAHPVKESGHQPRGHLVIGDLVACIAADQERNLVARQFPAVAFFFNQVLWSHKKRIVKMSGENTEQTEITVQTEAPYGFFSVCSVFSPDILIFNSSIKAGSSRICARRINSLPASSSSGTTSCSQVVS